MHILFIFTRGVSLNLWQQLGILHRELEIYRRLANLGILITFLTYGDNTEKALVFDNPTCKILTNPWRLPATVFSLVAPLLYYKEYATTNIIKTNQIDGWWTAWLGKKIYHRPMILRCGFLLSLNYERKHGKNLMAAMIRFGEKMGFRAADRAVVTTEEIKRYVIEAYGIPEDKIFTIPNAIDTELFSPGEAIRSLGEKKICFVGAMKIAKNPLALIQAASEIHDLKVKILLIGDGPLRLQAEEAARTAGVQAQFLGVLPNQEIPNILRSCDVFVMPSLWEGQPKALLEAMSCGLPVIGYNSPGIREVISHDQNGWLCQPDARSLSAAIQLLLADEGRRERLGKAAREYVMTHFSIEQTTRLEFGLYNSLSRNIP